MKKEIIVIDNASSDNSVEVIKINFPQVRLIQNSANVGLARANNQGVRLTRGEYILFLNPDTVVQRHSMEKMVDFLKNNDNVAIVAPKLINPDGSIQLSCRQFYNLRTIILRRTFLGKVFINSKLVKEHLLLNRNHSEILEVDWILGACFLTKRDIFENIGCFDENYPLYFEDVDLCYRAKNASYKVIYFPKATVIHHHQRESAKKFSKKTLWHIKSSIKFFNKHGWKW